MTQKMGTLERTHLFLLLLFSAECLCRQVLRRKMCKSPRWQRTLHHRGLRKLALDSRQPGGARKMQHFRAKKTPHRHGRHSVRLSTNCASRTCITGTSTTGSKVLQLRDLRSFLTGESLWFSEQSGPRETASAPRQRCRRP